MEGHRLKVNGNKNTINVGGKIRASKNSNVCVAGRDAFIAAYYGLQLTDKENKLFGIIRALDDPDAFIDRIIQDGVGLLQAEYDVQLNAE